MAPKSIKTTAAEKQKDVQETEDPLQAVVLADSFETRFHPFTLEQPRCLLPLANVPLIDYTLTFLANSGVDQVFIYCGAHTDQLEEYIKQSKWQAETSSFEVILIRSTSRSIGDAMRDLDGKGILKNDFIVVYGDVVCNLNLDIALSEHRARRARDKNAIMTMVLRQASSGHRTAFRSTIPIFVNDPAQNRCIHYEQLVPGEEHHVAELNEELFLGRSELEVRADLIDCGIDICTPDVLALWSDNFDYEAARRGFLHSVLKDYELNGKTIHTYIFDDYYGARVLNLGTYHGVSRDVIARWAYPLCPDSKIYGSFESQYDERNRVYKEEDVKLSRSCSIGPHSVLGRGTRIGHRTKVLRSVIGRNCVIGEGCILEDAYIWDGSKIANGTTVKNSILGNEVQVGKDCNIAGGTLLSYGVKIADGTSLIDSRRLTRDVSHKGSKWRDAREGNYEFQPSDSEDDDVQTGWNITGRGRSNSIDSISSLESDYEGSSLGGSQELRTPVGSISSAHSDAERADRAVNEFVEEAASSIYESVQSEDDVSTIQLELQGLRMKDNASEHQLRLAIVRGLVRYVADSRAGGKPSKPILERNRMLIERAMFDKESAEKTDQVDFLLLAQQELSKRGNGDVVLLSLCNDLYLLDVLEEEGLEQWWQDSRGTSTDELRRVRAKTAQFMTALLEAESEEDEDDDDNE